MTCAAAQTVTLVGGKATIVDTTAGVADEFGLAVHCGFPNLAYIGLQLYYRVDLVAGKEYLFRLTSPFQSVLYISGDSCTPQQINAACGSDGATGEYIFVPPGMTNTILFKPPVTGTYRFAVDASQAGQYGHFTLQIEDYVIPAHATCTGALPVALLPKKTLIIADTCYGTNEFGLGINCGLPGFMGQLLGTQLYYKVALTAGKTYTFYFTPYYPYARLYLFSGTCAMDPINADCGSNGQTGGITPSVSENQQTWLKFPVLLPVREDVLRPGSGQPVGGLDPAATAAGDERPSVHRALRRVVPRTGAQERPAAWLGDYRCRRLLHGAGQCHAGV